MPVPHRPVTLIVLDGWGYSEQTEFNAIALANTPVWDRLWRECPHTLVNASGAAVGLPGGQMGNSEVGHMNLGAGRVVYQEFTRISRSIRTGSFYQNQTLTEAVDLAVANRARIHVIGLLSPGGVHSHEDHIQAMIELAAQRGARDIALHAILDGRDTPPRSADGSLRRAQATLDRLGVGRIASVIGRYYAMDRDNRWDRVQTAYELFTDGRAEHVAVDAVSALEAAYARGEGDEFVVATAIVPAGGKPLGMDDGDVVFFMNFRADRARQVTEALTEPGFAGFQRARAPEFARFVCLSEFHESFDLPVAFPPERLNNVFGEYIGRLGLHQLRIAETEKYAHVTFFFNGGREEPFDGEERILVPSPKVATYDLQPEMSAVEVTARLVGAIVGGRYDAIICNYANADMVGHTGKVDAAIKAVETLDTCLGRVIEALRAVGGELIITADHGNAEKMVDPETGQPHTAHTSFLVPLIYVGRPAELADSGALCDVAPTLLQLMELPVPDEMTGRSLISFNEEAAVQRAS